MPSVTHNKDADPPFDVGLTGITKNRNLKTLIEDIYERLPLKISVDGIIAQEIDGGIHLKVTPGTLADILPFACSMDGEGTITVEPGTFAGVIPATLSFASSTSGTVYVYLRVTSTLSVAHSYVYSYGTFGVTVAVAGSVPADTRTSSFVGHIPLAKFEDGEKTAQYVINSLSGFIEDDGTATSKGWLYWF